MKYKKNIIVLTFIFCLNELVSAQNDFGVILGGNFATQTFFNPERPQDEKTQYDNIFGFNSGIYYKRLIKPKLHIRASLFYQQLGFKQPIQTGTIGDPGSFQNLSIEDRFNYTALDIEFLFYFTKKSLSPYVFGGIRNGYLLSHKASYDIELIKYEYPFNQLNDFNKYVFGWRAGFGLTLNKNISCDFSFNRDITAVLSKPTLEAKNWFWSFNIYVGLIDLFAKKNK